MPSADRAAVTNADFYLLEQSLEDEGRQLLRQVREYMEKSVEHASSVNCRAGRQAPARMPLDGPTMTVGGSWSLPACDTRTWAPSRWHRGDLDACHAR